MNVLITSGPTQEPMDPVRFLTNPSSGEMGYHLARAFLALGAEVAVVSGPVQLAYPKAAHIIPIRTALDMHEEVMSLLPKTDVLVAAAAVSDYRFGAPKNLKVKKGLTRLTVKLVKNPDILENAGLWKKKRKGSPMILIGFALETHDLEKMAFGKLVKKNLDLIIGNTPESFGRPIIQPYWLEKGEKGQWLSFMTKEALAKKISMWARTHKQSTLARGRKKTYVVQENYY